VKRHLWATAAIVFIDVLALEYRCCAVASCGYCCIPLFPISLGTPQYAGLVLGCAHASARVLLGRLYPGYGLGAVQRIRGRVLATFFVFLLLLVWNYSFHGHPVVARRTAAHHVFRAGACSGARSAAAAGAGLARHLRRAGRDFGRGNTGAMVVKTLKKENDLGFVPLRDPG